MNIEIANHLFELRRKAGLSQEALAEKLGLSRQAISKWERGEAAPDMDNLLALARLYNMSLDELLLFGRDAQSVQPAPADGNDFGRADCDAGCAKPTEHPDCSKETCANCAGAAGDAGEPASGTVALEPAPAESPFDENAIRMLNASYPTLMAAVFFALGFLGGWWHPGWMVFLTIPLYYTLIPALRRRDHRIFAYPVALVIVYLSLGFAINAWAWGWLLFLTIPPYYTWKPEK